MDNRCLWYNKIYMNKKLKIVLFIGSIFFIALGSIALLQNRRIIKMPCLPLIRCPLGGICVRFEGKHVCLNGYKDGTICNYCESGVCHIGESIPLYFYCSNEPEKGFGVIPSSEKLKNQFCRDNDSGEEISYQEALDIAQKDKCGLKGEELVTFSENYLCNENTGTWWIDLNIRPEKKGCSPACVVDIVDKTAEVNWRCTGLIPSQ